MRQAHHTKFGVEGLHIGKGAKGAKAEAEAGDAGSQSCQSANCLTQLAVGLLAKAAIHAAGIGAETRKTTFWSGPNGFRIACTSAIAATATATAVRHNFRGCGRCQDAGRRLLIHKKRRNTARDRRCIRIKGTRNRRGVCASTEGFGHMSAF